MQDNQLNEEEFLNFFRTLTARPELDPILRMFSSSNENFLTAEDLRAFLVDEQKASNATDIYNEFSSKTSI